jgi:hypothetical protein
MLTGSELGLVVEIGIVECLVGCSGGVDDFGAGGETDVVEALFGRGDLNTLASLNLLDFIFSRSERTVSSLQFVVSRRHFTRSFILNGM